MLQRLLRGGLGVEGLGFIGLRVVGFTVSGLGFLAFLAFAEPRVSYFG